MSRTITPVDADIPAVGALLRDLTGGVIVATHRNPDGDAIGSLLAVARVLRARGLDVVMWHPDHPAVPHELVFLLRPGEEVVAQLPPDAADRTVIALDCANAGRLAEVPVGDLGGRLINIDHHHDNGRYGDVNLVDATMSSTAELVLAVMDAGGLELTVDVAEPLHVGVVTDTGRLSYSNTTPATLRADARLVATGIDVAALARALYENADFAQVRLTGIALGRAERLLDGRLVVSVLRDEDFHAAGTSDADGIAELLRGVRGAEVGALVRASADGVRASLRAASDRVDVSAIARAAGGGGHRAAAGASAAGTPEEFVAWLAERVAQQLDAAR